MRKSFDKTAIYVRLSKAAPIVKTFTGERVHSGTIARWATRGLVGVKLRTIYAGGCRRTTEQWIREFFDQVTAAKQESGPKELSSDRESVEYAERELGDAGI